MQNPTTDSAELSSLKRDYPEWEFAYVRDLGVWMALNKPTQSSEHVLVGRELDELRTKLERR